MALRSTRKSSNSTSCIIAGGIGLLLLLATGLWVRSSQDIISRRQQKDMSYAQAVTVQGNKPNCPPSPENVRTVFSSPQKEAIADGDCMTTVTRHYKEYFGRSEKSSSLRKLRGTLNIAAFSRLWVPPLHGTGGMQYHALHLYTQLARRGHTVHVFVTGPQSRLRTLYFSVDSSTLELKAESEGSERVSLTVHQVASDRDGEYSESFFENALVAFRAVNASLGTRGFDVAHSESWAGVPNIYQIGLQMAVTWHGSMLDWFRNEINLIVHNFLMRGKMPDSKTATRMGGLGNSVAYESYMLLSVPHHIVISDSAAQDLRDINLIHERSIHLIYNGVNPNNFKPANDGGASRRKFLAEYGVPESHYVVGCGGRLEGIKGHHQLSKAMEIVLTKHKDSITLLVAGTGNQAERYEKMKHAGMNVVLLGMLPQTKLASFYQALDVFVDPFYQHHGLNTVMLEAVLSGIPIIATSLASAKTTAPCADFGRTFSLGSVPELAAAIEYYKDNRDERLRVGENVRTRALHLFSSDIMAGAYEALLYEMITNPVPLKPITGRVVCRHTYPAMCYREPQ
jgi:glycosyltransferase involved in cell wall biosynthesis